MPNFMIYLQSLQEFNLEERIFEKHFLFYGYFWKKNLKLSKFDDLYQDEFQFLGAETKTYSFVKHVETKIRQKGAEN